MAGTCRQTLDFSSRYCSILAPSIAPLLLKWMSMYFPNREELSLRIVLALPKAVRQLIVMDLSSYVLVINNQLCKNGLMFLPSSMGLASSTCCSIQECCPLIAARN